VIFEIRLDYVAIKKTIFYKLWANKSPGMKIGCNYGWYYPISIW